MRHLNLRCTILIAASACGATASAGSGSGLVVCWGDNASSQQCEVPAGLTGVVKVAAGSLHTVALKSDGTVVCWGWTAPGCAPPSLSGVVDIAAGADHAIGLRADGTLVAWGDNANSIVPPDLPAVARVATGPGAYHTSAVTVSGTVRSWGTKNVWGELNVPPGLAGVSEVAVAGVHNAALKNDGSVVCWGWNYFNQCSVPIGLPPAQGVAAGTRHTLALLADGTVRAWGYNASGQCTPPSQLSGVEGLAAGENHSVALVVGESGVGQVVCWGDNSYGQRAVPDGLRGVIQVAAGNYHTVALVADCNGDGVADADQCRVGSLADYDGNNVPDCCESGTPCEVGHYPVQWRVEDGGNGHWYRFVPDIEVSWQDSRIAAEIAGGHLATLTSPLENNFVFDVVSQSSQAWSKIYGPFIGATRRDSTEWSWVTQEPFLFHAWGPGEPNNDSGGAGPEDRLAMLNHPSEPASWNDVTDSGCGGAQCQARTSSGYVIEWSDDCNGDGIVDYGQILQGQLVDADGNGVPDSCEPAPCPGDVSGDGQVDGVDLASVLSQWGGPGSSDGSADVNGDGVVEGKDLAIVLSAWGYCVTVPAWATLLEAYPDPAVVHNSALRASIHATGLAWRVRDTATQIEMVLVPPGTFQMGCSPSQAHACSSAEGPVHQVTLTQSYFIGRYEVTQAQWTGLMGSNPSQFSLSNGYADADDHPVDSVSWEAVQEFVSLVGLRLPTEAEWEHACRAGTQTAFHGFFGYLEGTDDDGLVEGIAWFLDNSGFTSNPVGQRSANGLGVHDMSGNVWEWVGDWWSASYYSVSPSVNPPGPPTGSYRVIRGGAWNSNTNIVRASYRSFFLLGSTSSNVGFRVARNP